MSELAAVMIIVQVASASSFNRSRHSSQLRPCDAKRLTLSSGIINYQTCGTRRYRIFARYSSYPAKFFARNFSSSSNRHTIQIEVGINVKKPHNEPRARGVPRTISNPPLYIGGRTIAYGPVEITL